MQQDLISQLKKSASENEALVRELEESEQRNQILLNAQQNSDNNNNNNNNANLFQSEFDSEMMPR